jgi:hypothetical protein
MIRKGFKNTSRLCYYIFTDFELSDNMIILFKLINVFAKVLRFIFRLLSIDFNQRSLSVLMVALTSMR